MFREIEKVFKNTSAYWVGNGFRVQQYFPEGQGENFLERFSPFIMMDYNPPYHFNATDDLVGIGPHPHRGFETVTLALDAVIEHTDNQGNTGVIHSGDIQWMTAGCGILHKEYHEKKFAKNDRMFHMIQLWINLPKKNKMTKPKYQSLLDKDMGKYNLENNLGEITVFAGEVFNTKGPASTFSPINMYKVSLKKDADVLLDEPDTFNTGALVVGGSMKINDQKTVNEGDFILFKNDKKAFKLTALSQEAVIIVLSGEPLNEPVVTYGPFVMNTQEEINTAITDFQSGKFGSLEF